VLVLIGAAVGTHRTVLRRYGGNLACYAVSGCYGPPGQEQAGSSTILFELL
jgi:hypothetical protein